MDVLDMMPDGAVDRHAISFRLAGHRSEVACAITREAREAQFWLPPDADQRPDAEGVCGRTAPH
jgi:hypothetical protein